MGWTAEPMSWRKPGTVRGRVLTEPPRVEFASRTRTERPRWARTMAAERPLGPEPTIIAS